MARRRSLVRVARPQIVHVRRSPARHRRRFGGGGGGRWGVDAGDVALSALAGMVGQVVSSQVLARWTNAPDIIRQAPIEALGLYVLGVLFRRADWRDIGAGLAVGRYMGIGVATP